MGIKKWLFGTYNNYRIYFTNSLSTGGINLGIKTDKNGKQVGIYILDKRFTHHFYFFTEQNQQTSSSNQSIMSNPRLNYIDILLN